MKPSKHRASARSGMYCLTRKSLYGIRAGLFEVIMRRYNRRLYRIARAIVGEALARVRRAGRF